MGVIDAASSSRLEPPDGRPAHISVAVRCKGALLRNIEPRTAVNIKAQALPDADQDIAHVRQVPWSACLHSVNEIVRNVPTKAASQQSEGKQIAATYVLEIEGSITYAIGTECRRPVLGRARPIMRDLDLRAQHDGPSSPIGSVGKIKVLG